MVLDHCLTHLYKGKSPGARWFKQPARERTETEAQEGLEQTRRALAPIDKMPMDTLS